LGTVEHQLVALIRQRRLVDDAGRPIDSMWAARIAAR
jgi:hypothetical protein